MTANRKIIFLWLLVGFHGCKGWTEMVVSRRQAFLESISTGILMVGSSSASGPRPAFAMDSPSTTIADASRHLVSIIPSMPYGAPATNSTLVLVDASLVNQIETLAHNLEVSGHQRDNAISPLLSGNGWRLVYSNAPEISSLAANLPPGFHLGKTYQPIDTTTSIFENRSPILVGSRNGLFRLAQLVITIQGDLTVASKGTVNAVNVVNDDNNRVNVDFRAIDFTLEQALGITGAQGGPLFTKTLIPNADKSRAQPANDVTYLDENMRIVRGGDGALFIFVRESNESVPPPTKRTDVEIEKATIRGQEVDVGIGVAEKSQSPELQFLFQSR